MGVRASGRRRNPLITVYCRMLSLSQGSGDLDLERVVVVKRSEGSRSDFRVVSVPVDRDRRTVVPADGQRAVQPGV